jgi:hypothetical protein
VHEHEPVTFETRWTLSYLRGPMGRDDLRRAANRSGGSSDPPAAPAKITPGLESQARPTPSESGTKPVLPVGVQEYYLRGDGRTPSAYAPVLYGAARVRYTDTKKGIDVVRSLFAVVPMTSGPVQVDWDKAALVTDAPDSLSQQPAKADVRYGTIPAAGMDQKKYAAWTKDFGNWIGRAQALKIFSVPALKLVSNPEESERDFQIRIQHATRESRDAALESLRAKYATKIARVAEKKRKAEETVGREQQQATQQRLQTVVSMGATVFGALMGRRAVSLSTLGRATTAARGVSRSMKETQDVATAQQRLLEAQQEEAALNAEIEQQVTALSGQAPGAIATETIEIKPKRGGVEVQIVALAWQPTEY